MRSIIEKRPVHIVTIEDPIEYLFADGKAAVSQREVSTDTPAFAEALKNMFRQDPDVVMVGEMRDWQTIQTVITAAETGHLVFSTLHTNSAGQSIDRILDTCPVGQQQQIRSQLALVLRAIVSMRLIEKSDGSGLVPVCEIMINSPKVAKHIERGETKEIHDEIETSVGYYRMQTMNQSLIALLVNGRITYERAMQLSTDPEDLSLKLRKLFPQIEEEQRGGLMASDNDFSAITQLMDVKRLYEGAGREVEAAALREGRRGRALRHGAARAAPRDPDPRAVDRRDGGGGHPAESGERAVDARLPAEDRPVERAHQGVEPARAHVRAGRQGRRRRGLLQEVTWRAEPRRSS
jgi:hypothetical protein